MSLPCYEVSLILVGEAYVGKSALLETSYLGKVSDFVLHPTIGVDFRAKRIESSEWNLFFKMWDTAGAERFRSITSSYYRFGVVALLVFDVTKRDSVDNLEQWIENILVSNPDAFIIIVANKMDKYKAGNLEHQSIRQIGEETARKYKLFFLKTSRLRTDLLYRVGDCVTSLENWRGMKGIKKRKEYVPTNETIHNCVTCDTKRNGYRWSRHCGF